jgi:cell fate (sporulation/competence/biofilm development) regulator YlbF (YheA/YmcA/DUF963 family)
MLLQSELSMANTDEILQAAAQLGQMIAEHDTAKKLEAVISRLRADTDAQRALNDFNRHVQSVSEKEAAGKPIEVADKHKLEQLQMAVIRNPILRDFQLAQMDYVDLMRRVDEAMQGQSAAAAEAVSPRMNPDLSDLRGKG